MRRKALGVEDQRQEPVHHAGSRVGVARSAARQRAGEDVRHNAQAVALVSTERKDGAGRIGVKGLGVLAGAALGVDDGARRQRLPLVEGDLDLSLGDGASGNVEDDRRPILDRDPHRDGVGGKAPVDPSKGGREDTEAARVDEVKGDLACPRGQERPFADPSKVAAVSKGQDQNAVLFALRDGKAHRLLANHLTEAELAVHHGQHLGLEDHFHALVGPDHVLLEEVDVVRHADDAVGVVSREVRFDQVMGDPLGFGGKRAGLREDGLDEALQSIGGDFHGSFQLISATARTGEPSRPPILRGKAQSSNTPLVMASKFVKFSMMRMPLSSRAKWLS